MSDDWYLEDDFWRNFGSLMFNAQTFAEGADQIDALLELLETPPRAVLDLGCGPGRHSLPLAEAGYPVTAVDTSRSLLDQLDQRKGELPIETVEADMRVFERADAFDLVLVMWTSFGYFENEADHGRVLDRIHASLSAGGRLVLDLVGVEYLARNLQPVHLTEYEDGRILIERPALIDHMTRLDNDWYLIDGDRVHRTHISHRVWSAGEIRRLLSDHGLTVESLLGGYDGEDYDLDAERMIVIARKLEGDPR
ncbi:class I SAM-dependent methyltransferase [Wenzhouxiangella marina]|uniref:Methyltransferase type 11 n=1 Tax=Wenzhouxiangella marina TaxID=1579979 RepID=A0A0K0XZ88_9GAMM|nr:class I SAM-dependent methyltransferase [Wenzhouxiangella marina]AKS42947.1 Methyltransferase type 11 [Wenzhouxiangella marina]MBB6087369.1 SAM-dependent methyltransferase [Wenzhouxiangella marina]